MEETTVLGTLIPTELISEPPSLQNLPFEIVAEILMNLMIADVLSATLVCRSWYAVACSRAIWQNLSFHMLCRSRPLPLQGFTLPDDLTAVSLKQAVLKALFLEHNWNSPSPRCVAAKRSLHVRLPAGDTIVRVWRITSNYILAATEYGSLVCWETDRDVSAGGYDLGDKWIVFNCRAIYSERRVVCITGKYPETDGHMEFALLEVRFPDAKDDTIKVSFVRLASFSLPHSHVLDLYILDPHRRMACVLFIIPDSYSVGLYTLHDWDTGLNSLIDTGIAFCQSKVTATSLSQDLQHIEIHIESWARSIHLSYSLVSLISHASTRTLYTLSPAPSRLKESSTQWSDALRKRRRKGGAGVRLPSSHLIPMGSYFFRQWWPTYERVPVKTSTTLIYHWPVPGEGIWRLAQHYTETSPSTPSSALTSSAADPKFGQLRRRRRFIATMHWLVCVPHDADGVIQPLLDVDFSHAVWVEFLSADPSDKAKRMRLATFGDGESDYSAVEAGDDDVESDDGTRSLNDRVRHNIDDGEEGEEDGDTSVKTLDVPPDVLDDALHLVIDQSQGSIMVSTSSGDLHVFPFA